MNTFILIVMVHAGVLASTNSVAITNIPGFFSEKECLEAGEKAKTLDKGTVQSVKFVCVKQKLD